MRPKSVFLPYEDFGGVVKRADDLPVFDDIDKARRFMMGKEARRLARRRITFSEHFDDAAIDEYMARKRPS